MDVQGKQLAVPNIQKAMGKQAQRMLRRRRAISKRAWRVQVVLDRKVAF
jgi:hypothetical protein